MAPQSARASKLSRLFDYDCELFFRTLSSGSVDDQAWINRYTIDDNLIRLTEEMEPMTLAEVTKEEERDLLAIRELATKHGIALQIVVAPYLPAYRALLTNLDARTAHLEAILAPSSVFDISSAITDKACFADRLHSNLQGSHVIFDKLDQLGVFAAVQ